MKDFSAALTVHLEAGVTSLCACWTLIRADGVRLGFTDHDRTLSFDGVTYEPQNGLTASGGVAHAGLEVGGLDVAGALSSERLSEEDLLAGLYDNARVEMWLVNWAAPAMRHLMRIASIGEVTREDHAFKAELRGLAHALDQESGRLFAHLCDADLGDGRCRVDLAALRVEASVTATDGAGWIETVELGAEERVADGSLARGLLTFLSGANEGRAIEVARHAVEGTAHRLTLWQKMERPIAVGDRVAVTPGCDKRLATCRGRFGNTANFRGFPHMPGNDFVWSVASVDRLSTVKPRNGRSGSGA
ncbi:DUF2163 domain-containing protein [Afifella sp. JA880]|uniref:DUF2163 domain-containing protein n=1 Tax=Afifella sp. JA880 TaxID=2975280 RepID=UPI0021BA8DF1|nr:DUF2163 domain-containing protein [Afifella sp. JA880]MCT8266763.1 DUF2163 domain-containing protein [Afifella sp. JA880]